jgi:hypothetical protein
MQPGFNILFFYLYNHGSALDVRAAVFARPAPSLVDWLNDGF